MDIKNQVMTLTEEKFSWRAAAQLTLPKEHGSWSLALEPVAFGLLVAPSAAGAALALAAVSGFFLRRPLKFALAAKSDSRQPLALVCAAHAQLQSRSSQPQPVLQRRLALFCQTSRANLMAMRYAYQSQQDLQPI